MSQVLKNLKRLVSQLFYEVILGQKQGPRLGSFIKFYGITKTVELLESKGNKIDMEKFVYRVLFNKEWERFQKIGFYKGNELDKILCLHLSNKQQLKTINIQYKKKKNNLVILKIESKKN